MSILVILLCLAFTTQAQESDYLFDAYGTKEGLSNNNVNYIYKDTEGFMWFGTWDGLARFDGLEFKTYDAFNHPVLKNARVLNIKEDACGHLWTLTYDKELYCFDKRTETYRRIKMPEGFSYGGYLFDRQGVVWVWSTDGKLYHIKPDTRTGRLGESVAHPVVDGSSQINFVSEIKNRVFAATDAGLYELSETPSRDRMIASSDGYTGGYVIHTSSGNKVYLGTLRSGIFEYDLLSDSLVRLPGSARIAEVSALKRTKDAILLAGTRNQGLWLYDLHAKEVGSRHTKENDPAFPSSHITHIAKEGDRYWIRTPEVGITLFKSDENTFRHYTLDTEINPLSTNSIVRLYGDKVLVNSHKQGLGVYDPQTDRFVDFYKEIGVDPNFFSPAVHHLYIDDQNNIWMSPWSKKLYKISRQRNQINYVTPTPSRRNMANEVRAINENRDGEMWIGTREGGILCYDQNRNLKCHIQHYTGSDGARHPLNAIYSILIRANGEVWLGTKGNGIVCVNGNGNSAWARQLEIDALAESSVYALQEDRHGRVWIGTFGTGLMMLEKQGNRYTLHDARTLAGYPSNHLSVRTLMLDRRDILWIGTTDGLLSLNTHRQQLADIRTQEIDPSASGDLRFSDVHAIEEDRRGVVWVGSTGGGLAALKEVGNEGDQVEYQITRYSTNDGLPSNSIISLCEDDAGNLWIGSEDNVCRFDILKSKFYTFTRGDGFREATLTEKGAFTTAHGEIVFGTTTGFFTFDPSHIAIDSSKFNLVFTDFHLLNSDAKPQQKQGRYVLRHNQSFFSIEYAGLDYAGGDNIRYSYTMENLDDGWIFAKGERKATYTNLAPGKYTFKVRASKDTSFGENSPVQTMEITVLPPWWKTVLAKVLYGLATIALFLVLLRALSRYYQIKHRAEFEAELHEMRLHFFTNISHELRTPMTLMIGPIEKLLSQKSISAENMELVRYLDRNAHKLLGIVNQILDFRKVQNDKMDLHRENMELVAFARTIFNNMGPAASEKRINFGFSTNVPELDVEMDSQKIDAIIQNLLSNAIKFTPENGDITLSIRCSKELDMVEIVVQDSGIGIARDRIPTLFDRFASVSPDPDPKYRGTGIGLYLVRSFADLHGGSVEVESGVNRGSTFTVRLPYAMAVQTAQDVQEKTTDTPSKSAARVLVVDDNHELRSFIRSLLCDRYVVLEAADGQEALGIIRDQLPDLVISDIMMPGIDGIELLKKVRGNIKTSHILFILLSAKSSIEDQIAGIEYGADDYIVKPFNTQLLQRKIDNVFERRSKHYSAITENLNVVPLYPDVVVCQKRDEEMLRKVISLIEENMQSMNNLNIEDLVKSLGLSRTVFYKKIKSLTGLSPIELVRDIRIKRGAQLVLTREYTVAEISTMVGFSDVRYFSRCFKAKYGVNPSEYKRDPSAPEAAPESESTVAG